MRFLLFNLMSIFFLGISLTCMAQSEPLQIDGFGSILYSKTDSEGYENADLDERGSYINRSKIGLSVRKNFTDKIRGQILFLSSGRNYRNMPTRLDLAQLSYEPFENTTIRFGRIRLPFWLNAEFIQVGALNYWAMQPYLIYDKFFIKTMDGINLNYRLQGSKWTFMLDYNTGDLVIDEGFERDYSEGNAENLHSFMAKLESDWLRLMASYTTTKSFVRSIKTVSTYNPLTDSYINTDVELNFDIEKLDISTGGFRLNLGRFFLQSEILWAEFDSKDDMVERLSAYYADLGVKLGKKRDYTLYYSFSEDIENKIDPRTGYEEKTIHSFGITHNYNQDLALKFQWFNVQRRDEFVYTDTNEFLNILVTGVDFIF